MVTSRDTSIDTDGGAVRFAARLKDSSRFVFGADSNSPRPWKSNSGIEKAPASEGGRYTGGAQVGRGVGQGYFAC